MSNFKISRFQDFKIMATIKKQQRVMHMAHLLYEYSKEVSCISDVHPDWSASVKEAWSIERVREAMQKGVVNLYYVNSKGEDRFRLGTLSLDYIPAAKAPKGIAEQEIADGLRNPEYNIVNYYDLTAQGWRSFDINRLCTAERVTNEIRYSFSGLEYESIY